MTDGGVEEDGGGDTNELFSTDRADATAVGGPDRLLRLIDQYVYAPAGVAWSDWRTRIGIPIVAFFFLIGTVGVLIIPEAQINQTARYLQPFDQLAYPLGANDQGEGIARLLVHQTPDVLLMGTAGALFGTAVGTLIALVSGYKGGAIDRALMTLTDIVLTMPGTPLLILLVAIYQPQSSFMVGIIVSIDSWPGTARSLRSQVLQLREESFVEASRAMGMPTSRIITHDVLPQLGPLITMGAAGAFRGVITAAVGLYFLGFLPGNTSNWGVMMSVANERSALSNPSGRHWLFFPAITLTVFSFGLVMLAQGMDRVWNPELRASHAKTIASDDEEEDTASPLN